MNALLTQIKSVRGLDSGPLCRHVQPYFTQLELEHKRGNAARSRNLRLAAILAKTHPIDTSPVGYRPEDRLLNFLKDL